MRADSHGVSNVASGRSASDRPLEPTAGRPRLPTATRPAHVQTALLAAGLAVAALAGCASTRPFAWWPGRPLNCVLPEDASLEQVVGQLNQNVVPSWRSTDVRLTARQGNGIPVTLTAILAVQEPRRLRLIATNSFGNNEFDLGSNDQRFWFWVRRAEPKCVLTASYEDLPRLSQQLRVPFQPEWLMQVLGVVRLDPERLSLERVDRYRVRLVSHETTLQGTPVRKVVVVDTCRGVAVEHALYDSAGHLLARATLSDHQRDSLTGAVVPHRIDLDWPPTGLHLTLRLGKVEVNPVGIADRIWQLPDYPDSQVVDLARAFGPVRPVSGTEWRSAGSSGDAASTQRDGRSHAALPTPSAPGQTGNAGAPPFGSPVGSSPFERSKPSRSFEPTASEPSALEPPFEPGTSRWAAPEPSAAFEASAPFEPSPTRGDASGWPARSSGLQPTTGTAGSTSTLWRKSTSSGLR